MQIKSVVIIGSGTMGSGIAAHLCNANVPVTLLDLSTDISSKARERIYKSRPPLLIDKNKIDNIAKKESLTKIHQNQVNKMKEQTTNKTTP